MNKEKFISQIQEYKREMFLLAFSIVKNYHDAEDAVAETLLKSYEKLDSLKNKEQFKFWIMQILANNSKMILRKNKKLVCVDEMDAYLPEKTENNSVVWESVLSLEDELRIIVILYYYQGFKVKEISKIVGIPEGTVKSQLSVARKKLKVLLG